MNIILCMLNPLFVFLAVKVFYFDKVPYLSMSVLLVLVVLMGYSVFGCFYSHGWHKILYHAMFALLNGVLLLSLPLGMTFALIGGYVFALKILLLFYLPVLLLVALNVRQLILLRND